MKSLPFDVARCTGSFLPEHEGGCPERGTCARYLAYAEWDMNTFSASYRNSIWISVAPARSPCEIKIEVGK